MSHPSIRIETPTHHRGTTRPGTAVAQRVGLVRGFTLIELMVTVSVLAVLLAIAAPSFAQMMAANRLTTHTNELVGALSLARGEAVRRVQPVSLRATEADNYAKGWTVFPDINGDGAAANSDTDGKALRTTAAFTGSPTIKRQTCSGTPTCTWSDSTDSARIYVVFTPRGAMDAGKEVRFKICDPANTTVPGRVVRVGIVGTISLLSTSASCS